MTNVRSGYIYSINEQGKPIWGPPVGGAGSMGATGATGLAGGIGATGVSGTNGATGATGVSGTNGATGATGVSGTNGATGATGLTGGIGATGATGSGATGATGLVGATGAAGSSSLPSPVTSYLATDVTMTTANTFYSGPSVSLSSGTYLIIARATVASNTNTAQRVTARLSDTSTTYYAESEGATPAAGTGLRGSVTVVVTAIVAFAVTTSVGISATSTAANSILKAEATNNSSLADTATGVIAIKLNTDTSIGIGI